MTEILFNKKLQVHVKCKDCDDRRSTIRISVELQFTSNPIHKKDLVIRLTDDVDLYFLYNLTISEEDFQSLKVQQGLLVDFSSFPQRFIDLLEQCLIEQDKESPRFLLQLCCSSSSLDHGPASLNVVETNPFKHLTHLSLKLLHGTDVEIKKFLASCLANMKEEKQLLEQRLKKTEEDLSRQLSFTQQTLAEKSRELDKLRSEWTSQTTSLSTKHTQDLTTEREKALETQTRLQQQNEQLRRELETMHQRSTEQLQSRLAELDASSRDLTDRRYRNEATIRDLKAKLTGVEEECQRAKQQVSSLRRENGTLDQECHAKERELNQLHTRVAVLEQEVKDKEQLLARTRDVLDATQQQKTSVEGNAESKQLQIGRLETTVKSLSEELIKANSIIKKLQGDVKMLVGKMKVKNAVTVSQEKLVKETADKLQQTQTQLQAAQTQLTQRDDEVSKLKEQLDATVQKLDESREVLKTNENVITWLNKQLNENQLSRKHESQGAFESPPALSAGAGLRMGGASSNLLDGRSFPPSALGYPSSSPSALGYPSISPSGLGYPSTSPSALGYPVTSTLNSKHSFPSAGGRPVFGLHNPQASGPKVQFNPMSAKPSLSPVERRDGSPPVTRVPPSNKENDDPVGLDSKYLERRDDSIPLRGLLTNMNMNKEVPKPALNRLKAGGLSVSTAPSAYFPG
ncbi:spindle assembly abnormal protein 6 homolog isoform X1 [Alosa sapidissima]|uniref:spindle assembly abnormal protein 6 homolog isoform X1 n=1 Tax=Alosa sapidissima TaxID=34773 RepID=UPI001C08DAD9|nr:spindle assembly abnormal protein 6 homolog isoform X1 [Alosa sapidissima]XP_041913196.1 spindle assembly abnormal protein 6 homolog isoform X1 [Alosa sapidissima]